MKYLITTEDGEHFTAEKYTDIDFDTMIGGYITIVRLSDGKILDVDGSWVDLPVYPY